MAKKGKLITQQRLANLVAPLILRNVLRDYYNQPGGNMKLAALAFSKSYGVQMSAMSYRRHMEQVGLEVRRTAVEIEKTEKESERR